MKFFPMGLFEELENEKISWEDIKIGCPCNNYFCHNLLHQKVPEDVKCHMTGYKCESIACPFLIWFEYFYKYKENLFTLLEKNIH